MAGDSTVFVAEINAVEAFRSNQKVLTHSLNKTTPSAVAAHNEIIAIGSEVSLDLSLSFKSVNCSIQMHRIIRYNCINGTERLSIMLPPSRITKALFRRWLSPLMGNTWLPGTYVDDPGCPYES